MKFSLPVCRLDGKNNYQCFSKHSVTMVSIGPTKLLYSTLKSYVDKIMIKNSPIYRFIRTILIENLKRLGKFIHNYDKINDMYL